MMKKDGTFLPLHNMVGGSRASFPISPYLVISSAVLWLVLLALALKGLQFVHVYLIIDDSDLNTECTKKFEKTEKENLEIVDKYKKGDAGPYLRRLSPGGHVSNTVGKQAPAELDSIPPLVTAVSSADFWDVQGLIRQVAEKIRPMYKDVQFIIFNVGLYSSEAELMKQYCQCELRTFERSVYPPHFDIQEASAWRPVIIQKILEEYGSILWLNPTSRLKSAGDLTQLKYRGSRDFLMWESDLSTPVVAYTNPKMFEYFGEPRCLFDEAVLIDVNALVFYRTDFTWNGIIKPWLKCVLNKDCISPVKSRYSGCLPGRVPRTTGCHRYDQSALSIIANRAVQFSLNSNTFDVPKVTFEVYDDVTYFPEQPWTYTGLCFVCLVVFGVFSLCIYLINRSKRNVGKSSFLKR